MNLFSQYIWVVTLLAAPKAASLREHKASHRASHMFLRCIAFFTDLGHILWFHCSNYREVPPSSKEEVIIYRETARTVDKTFQALLAFVAVFLTCAVRLYCYWLRS